MPFNQLRENDTVISVLRSAITSGSSGLEHVPALVKRTLREGCWQSHEIELTGEIASFDHFEDFVAEPPLEGLGTDIATLKRLCERDTDAMALIDEALALHRQHGGARAKGVTSKLYNIQLDPAPSGTSSQVALRRLRAHRQDLHAQVIAGELSPHAAMVQAGFRPRTITVAVEPERAARTLIRVFGNAEVRELIAALERLVATG